MATDVNPDELLSEAERDAWKNLARYKFWMFGYFAARWVFLNRAFSLKRPNPFKRLVALAREVIAAAAVAAVVSGCTTIDSHRAPDPSWPRLEVLEHRVGAVEMLRHCYRYVSLPMKLVGSIPFACAEINFAAKRCDIWAVEDAEEGVMEHELDHCAGRDHIGDNTLNEALRAYRAAGGK